ncbi:type I restriction-modification system specificity subunit [Dokdonia pacifica]|uniref:Type I restriction enzyme, S subunit n=1 Tax=Dokdonia pacifica TaxID=1627892 RepID=A0A238W2Q6_9FLAO|nr:restriction endonuclease subunit S [Dokdonia pacifica]GGG15501.1 type I restriction-modification system specificity subunit [Dokdonia pacifica]SNR40816.1 type I restriction enzyme, S subunit [Dokdonia pacifica]
MCEILENTNKELCLDKSKWKLTKFGDVAIQQKGKVDRENTNLTRYIKGEHMGSKDLHIRKWGDLTDEYLGPAFIRKFEKGDILYGSRRTYLRKVAIADFDGITSNTTFVIKANETKIDKRLLPFIMMSEGFTENSIKNSKGSVNPYINWKDIAKYEFLLPPKDQQAKLAELLWAMDEVVERDILALNKIEATLNSNIENEIHGISLKGKVIREVLDEFSKKSELVPLVELGELLKGKGIPKADVKTQGLPCVRYGELYTKHHRVIRNFNSFISEEVKAKSFLLKKNDILFAGSGETITEIGKSAAFIDDIEAYAGSDTLLFRPYDMDGYYLGYLMNSQFVRQQLNKYGTGATVMHIYNSDLAKVKVPKIDKEDQVKIAEKLEKISNNVFSLEEKISRSKALQKSLINQVF